MRQLFSSNAMKDYVAMFYKSVYVEKELHLKVVHE